MTGKLLEKMRGLWGAGVKLTKDGWHGRLPLRKLLLPLEDALLFDGVVVYFFAYVVACLLLGASLWTTPSQGWLFLLVGPPLLFYLWWLKALWSAACQIERAWARHALRLFVILIPFISLACFLVLIVVHTCAAILKRLP